MSENVTRFKKLKKSHSAIFSENLTKYYGSHMAIKNLNLEVDKGEIFGFLGSNGAGKTTFIRILLDLIRPTKGEISVFGLNPSKNSVKIRSMCGYLPGELRLYENVTVKWLIMFFTELRGGDSKISKKAYLLCERLNLDLKPKIKNLSKGNKQKIGIVAAFMHSPDLLLLDEPTSGLDPLIQKSVIEIVKEAKNEGSTVFFSSHIFSEIKSVTNRFALVRNGSVVDIQKTSDLTFGSTVSIKVLFIGNTPSNKDLIVLENVFLKHAFSDGQTMIFQVQGNMSSFLRLLSHYNVDKLETTSEGIEELFFSRYSNSIRHSTSDKQKKISQ